MVLYFNNIYICSRFSEFMLNSAIIKKISDFVYAKPRSIQEIAHHIQKNWRTADSYVEKIMKEHGVLSIRTFREGTRGALKIVFWSNIEKIHSSDFQERLFKKIESSRDKKDFSPFDIYQYVDEKKRYAFLEEQTEDKITSKQNMIGILSSTQDQLLIFSGNLSWVNASQEGKKLYDVFEELATRNVSIKALCNVNLESMKNIQKMLEINDKLGKRMIEIKHAQQPFRAFVVDNSFVRFKEIRYSDRKQDGVKHNKYIFYDINDEEWVEWMQKIFWNLFRANISAEKRIKDIESIEKIK